MRVDRASLCYCRPIGRANPANRPAAILKADLQEAAKKLAARKIAEPLIRELLEPLERLSQAEESLAGAASARVIFRSHEVFRQFELAIASIAAAGVHRWGLLFDPSDSFLGHSRARRLRPGSDEESGKAVSLRFHRSYTRAAAKGHASDFG